MAMIVHENALITEARRGTNEKYPNTVYFSILDESGTYNYSTETLKLPDLLDNKMRQGKITIDATARTYQNRLNLTAVRLDFKPNAVPKSQTG